MTTNGRDWAGWGTQGEQRDLYGVPARGETTALMTRANGLSMGIGGVNEKQRSVITTAQGSEETQMGG